MVRISQMSVDKTYLYIKLLDFKDREEWLEYRKIIKELVKFKENND